MGGFDSFSNVFGAISRFSNATSSLQKSYNNYRGVTQGYQQAKENYDESERAIAEKAALDQQQIQLDNEQAARDRKNTLHKAVAAQQAKFGGQGIDTTDGSGEAAMLGLYKDSAESKAYRDQSDNLKLASITQDALSKRRKNLLNLQHNYETARDGFIRNFDSYTDLTPDGQDQLERDMY